MWGDEKTITWFWVIQKDTGFLYNFTWWFESTWLESTWWWVSTNMSHILKNHPFASFCWCSSPRAFLGRMCVSSIKKTHMGVSGNRGTPSHHPFEWDFPYQKPSIFGYPHLWKVPSNVYNVVNPEKSCRLDRGLRRWPIHLHQGLRSVETWEIPGDPVGWTRPL